MTREDFYAACDSILQEFPERLPPPRRRTRWGPRHPGAGRYSCGLIRWFSPQVVQICLKNPSVSRVLSAVDALDYLRSLTRGRQCAETPSQRSGSSPT